MPYNAKNSLWFGLVNISTQRINIMKFAILGPGIVADYHSTAIASNQDLGAQLTAVGHYNQHRFEALSQKYEVPCITFDEILADSSIDAVCICTPSGQHAAQSIACAKAGKHIVVEKPMALSLSEADAMITAARENNVRLTVAFQRRTEPLFKLIKEALTGGDLGEISLASVVLPYFRGPDYYNLADWRGTWAQDGGGVLMNQGIHIIDLLVWYLGDPVNIKSHAGTLHRDIEVEDTISASLQFKNGSLATVTATTTVGDGAPHRIEIYGTNGSIQVEGEEAIRWHLKDKSLQTVAPPALGSDVDSGSSSDPRGITAKGHTAIIRDLIQSVRDNRTPVIDGTEGRRSLAAVNGIYKAAGYKIPD